MPLEIFKIVIAIVFQSLSNRSEIHGALDYFKVIRETQLDWVDRTVEHPSMLVALQHPQSLEAFGLQLLRSKL
jgi:hypothetical protein